MTTKWDDTKIEQLFKQLREEDEIQTPSFHEVLNVPRASRWQYMPPVLRYSAAVALVLFLVASAPLSLGFARPPAALPLEPTASLYNWQSPTNFLLDVPDDQLVTTLPKLETGATIQTHESNW